MNYIHQETAVALVQETAVALVRARGLAHTPEHVQHRPPEA
jgi:hypothetical protein